MRRKKPSNRGMTVLELTLAVGIVVLLAAMVWPSWEQSMARGRLASAASEVRNQLRDARRRAMADGIEFRVELDQENGRIRAIPANNAVDEKEDAREPKSEGGESTAATSDVLEFELPNGVVFMSASAFADKARLDGSIGEPTKAPTRSNPASDTAKPPAERETAWSLLATLYPDGSATDGSVVVADESMNFIEVRLDRWTGDVELSAIHSAGEFLESPEAMSQGSADLADQPF